MRAQAGGGEQSEPRCRLATLAATRRPLFRDRYAGLHPDGRRLIRGWYERARGGDDFEAFIYLWIAFNGWAACVSGRDSDTQWRDALAADPSLSDEFARLLAADSQTAAAAHRFAALWPVFRVDELRRRGVDYLGPIDDRAAAARRYRHGGARQFEPRCLYDHDARPVDWPHTLAVLYRVRCNLFHGEKSRSSENDRRVVASAHSTLLAFVDDAALF